MPTYIPTPEASTHSKTIAGSSDTTYLDGVYKFMGCSVIGVNMSLGYNGTPSSLSVTLVEDIANSDNFVEPDMPSLWAFSLPKGGLGQPIFYGTGSGTFSFHPNAFNPTNVPFYFSGICNNWSVGERDLGGKTISVSIVDVRDLLSGVQCLLNGFALSQNITGGLPRYDSVENIIDVFGYFNYGMESERNEYGIQFSKVKQAIEGVRVTVSDIEFEFTFTGDAFEDVPDWYRLDETILDVLAIATKVATDAGSDLVVIARKVNSTLAMIEFRAIKRENLDVLTQTEISGFISNRASIVESARTGVEYRNEPTSSVIIGGMRNSNYVAWPSIYDSTMHLTTGTIVDWSYIDSIAGRTFSGSQGFSSANTGGISAFQAMIAGLNSGSSSTSTGPVEDYNKFPDDIKVRLFGGSGLISTDSHSGSGITVASQNFDVDSGAIFPFWGFTPDDHSYPLIEPFLPLDHLVIDRISDIYLNLTSKIPRCKISVRNFTVRALAHSDVFLDGDGDSDDRPFAYVEEILDGSNTVDAGYIRGLPLNTEILRAALASSDAFFNVYAFYYPDIANAMYFSKPMWKSLETFVSQRITAGKSPDLKQFPIVEYLNSAASIQVTDAILKLNAGPDGFIPTGSPWLTRFTAGDKVVTAFAFRNMIYEHVRQYALDNMGKRFMVCLPKSAIMQRIWNGDVVPTRPEKPEIEYTIADRGYWESPPSEFDGLTASGTFSDTEDQIRRKFMLEDGRFLPMVVIDHTPSGNINFNSNGINKAMFQDLPTSEFRPNRIAYENPNYVFVSCSVTQLTRRPDLALVELPSSIEFDPLDGNRRFPDFQKPVELDREFVINKAGIAKYFWYFFKKDYNLREMIDRVAAKLSRDFTTYASEVIAKWIEQVSIWYKKQYALSMSTEKVMDLKAVIIPLTSTWVSYGPYYALDSEAKGMVRVDVDESLVPWNFERSTPWYTNLDAAGIEKLNRTLAVTDYIDTASIVCAGFPEHGPAQQLGYNSNLTGISVTFDIGGVRTTYNFSTYSARPGTYRKADYDNVSKARIDTRAKLPETDNVSLRADLYRATDGTNRFPF
jgi:hypothetical protein